MIFKIKTILFTGILTLSLLAACKKEDSINPTGQEAKTASISNIKVTEMAFTNPDGSGFDAGSGPDAYVIVRDQSNGKEIYRSGVVQDVKTGELPSYSLSSTPLLLPGMDRNYTVELFDQDGGLDPDDKIGEFLVDVIGNKNKTPKNLASSGNAPKMEVEMIWGF